jgi:hypothetical protein
MRREIEVWILIDAAGDAVAGDDADHVRERYADQIGELADADGFRLVKVKVSVPLPVVIGATAEVADDEPAEASAS